MEGLLSTGLLRLVSGIGAGFMTCNSVICGRGLIEDLGKLWGHLKEGFGMLISLYCKLLVVKLDFHQRTPEFPGNLSVDKETLLRFTSESSIHHPW